MRPGDWLTTGQLQVSRPMLWLGLKTSAGSADDTGPITGYWVTDDRSY